MQPKNLVDIAIKSMNDDKPSPLSIYYVDRMNIISSAKRNQRKNPDFLPDIRRALSRGGLDVAVDWSSVGGGSSVSDGGSLAYSDTAGDEGEDEDSLETLLSRGVLSAAKPLENKEEEQARR